MMEPQECTLKPEVGALPAHHCDIAMELCNISSNMDRLKFCSWQGLRQATDVTAAEREGKMFGCSFREREKDGSLLCGQ